LYSSSEFNPTSVRKNLYMTHKSPSICASNGHMCHAEGGDRRDSNKCHSQGRIMCLVFFNSSESTVQSCLYLPLTLQVHTCYLSHRFVLTSNQAVWGDGYLKGLRRTQFQQSGGFTCFLINPLKTELNPICYLLTLLGAHHFLHVSRISVKLLTFRRLMSCIYGAPILDVSRPHTTTQHSR